MVVDFDTLRYLQRSLISCEVLFHAESHSLESGTRYSGVH